MLIQKTKTDIFNNFSSSIIRPSLIQLSSNLVVAKFELMKLIPAKYTVTKAIAQKKLSFEHPIIETSSGTYALGLGIVCNELGLPFVIVSDPIIDKSLEQRLIDLGGMVQIVSAKADNVNVQVLRLETLQNYLKQNDKAYWTNQYDNQENRHAYYDFADYLHDSIGNKFTLVGAVGSGGSTCGTIERLRARGADVKLVGVDTFGSVLFGLPKENRELRGLGNSILPKNLLHRYFDEIHWMDAQYAYHFTNHLHAKKSLFCGPTTGVAYAVASYLANNNPQETVVFISPDPGHRYISTVYNKQWLLERYSALDNNLINPQKIQNIREANPPWCYIDWNKRNYYESFY